MIALPDDAVLARLLGEGGRVPPMSPGLMDRVVAVAARPPLPPLSPRMALRRAPRRWTRGALVVTASMLVATAVAAGLADYAGLTVPSVLASLGAVSAPAPRAVALPLRVTPPPPPSMSRVPDLSPPQPALPLQAAALPLPAAPLPAAIPLQAQSVAAPPPVPHPAARMAERMATRTAERTAPLGRAVLRDAIAGRAVAPDSVPDASPDAVTVRGAIAERLSPAVQGAIAERLATRAEALPSLPDAALGAETRPIPDALREAAVARTQDREQLRRLRALRAMRDKAARPRGPRQ